MINTEHLLAGGSKARFGCGRTAAVDNRMQPDRCFRLKGMAQRLSIIVLAGDADKINPAAQMGKIARYIRSTTGHVFLTCEREHRYRCFG